ncbi:hypothetical protein BpHYR1_042082 [Brachionus plicatilis]|uniref:Uncharacterized protein n=1 Tax=Brachionus plicatilis TaxID=10195 RepID=A0A3M7QW90_BRAPC|nr:hypothetical protein BpHYR1_042082 [Brachionus plicatilis]
MIRANHLKLKSIFELIENFFILYIELFEFIKKIMARNLKAWTFLWKKYLNVTINRLKVITKGVEISSMDIF